MTKKKRKLRLRKQVVFSIPIILFILMISAVLIINSKHSFSSELDINNNVSENNVSQTNEAQQEIESIKNNIYVPLNNYVTKRQIYNTVAFYADVFKIDINKTIEIAKTITSDFSSESYLASYGIPSNKSNGSTFNSQEAGIVAFVRELYSYPERFGYSIEQIRKNVEPDSNKIIKDGKTYVSNGNTFEQFLGKICDLYGLNKSIALAIVYEETGILKSGLFTYSNNVGGQRGYDGWLSFPTLEAGTIAFVLNLNNMVNKNGFDLSTDSGVRDLSSIYVYGHAGNPSDSWTGKVLYFAEKINSKDLFTIK